MSGSPERPLGPQQQVQVDAEPACPHGPETPALSPLNAHGRVSHDATDEHPAAQTALAFPKSILAETLRIDPQRVNLQTCPRGYKGQQPGVRGPRPAPAPAAGERSPELLLCVSLLVRPHEFAEMTRLRPHTEPAGLFADLA